jgi:phosphonate transport system ATP-binding protein
MLISADVVTFGAPTVNDKLRELMLEVRDLRVVYPNGFEALISATVTVRPGEIVAIIGRSGSGKSTLLRCINGLQPMTSGSVRLDGRDIARMTDSQLVDVRRSIGFIWQDYNVVKRSTVFTNVLTGRLGYRRGLSSLLHYFSRADRLIALRSLERVNLQHRARQRADRLSGGEAQRVAIARALAQQPRFLLADEPVSSLDVELSWQVMRDLVRVARDERVPTLVSLHDVSLAQAFADRVVGIADGRTVFDGIPSAIDDRVLDRLYRFERSGDQAAIPAPRLAAGL